MKMFDLQEPYREYGKPIGLGSYIKPTLLENLGERKASLESELQKVNSAISALNAAPEAMALLESLRKVNGLI
jgi:hypothetical protein